MASTAAHTPWRRLEAVRSRRLCARGRRQRESGGRAHLPPTDARCATPADGTSCTCMTVERDVLERAARVEYVGASSLAEETALSPVVVAFIELPCKLAELLSMRNETSNFALQRGAGVGASATRYRAADCAHYACVRCALWPARGLSRRSRQGDVHAPTLRSTLYAGERKQGLGDGTTVLSKGFARRSGPHRDRP